MQLHFIMSPPMTPKQRSEPIFLEKKNTWVSLPPSFPSLTHSPPEIKIDPSYYRTINQNVTTQLFSDTHNRSSSISSNSCNSSDDDESTNSQLTTIPHHRMKKKPSPSPSSPTGSFSLPVFDSFSSSTKVKHATKRKHCATKNALATPADEQNQSDSTSDESSGIIISKKAKTTAAIVYDTLDIDIPDQVVFSDKTEWIPKPEVFNRKPGVRVYWKGKI